jgi:hypothetical protein
MLTDREREAAWLSHQQTRLMRPDAARFLKPDWRDRKYWNGPPPPDWIEHPLEWTAEAQAQAARQLISSPDVVKAAIEDARRDLRELRALIHRSRPLHLLRKAGYDPNQSRDERGRWDGGGGGADEKKPEIPRERPTKARERNQIIKRVARWAARFAGPVGLAIEAGSWIYEDIAAIKAYQDAPRNLDELHSAVDEPRAGYDVHHIVEKTSAARDGYPVDMIDGRDNLVRIPRLKHWEINSWYMTASKDFDGLSPREYLRNRSWSERHEIGLRALVLHGVLRP